MSRVGYSGDTWTQTGEKGVPPGVRFGRFPPRVVRPFRFFSCVRARRAPVCESHTLTVCDVSFLLLFLLESINLSVNSLSLRLSPAARLTGV